MIDNLSARAPSIVVFTLFASLLSAWFDAPLWLPATLAIVVACLALLLFAARGGRHAPQSEEELDSIESRTWLGWELAGKGTPPGFYLLCFFGLLTVTITGFQSPHAILAWAGLALGVAWGMANRRYPTEEDGSP